jgi:hypothetical protein
LGLKGVQLESMGYLTLRHTLDWGDYEKFEAFLLKYNKYYRLNMRNLKSLKNGALTDSNYNQIENFIEYEDFCTNSYFLTLVKYSKYQKDFLDNLNSIDYTKSFYENMQSLLSSENSLIQSETRQRKQRT